MLREERRLAGDYWERLGVHHFVRHAPCLFPAELKGVSGSNFFDGKKRSMINIRHDLNTQRRFSRACHNVDWSGDPKQRCDMMTERYINHTIS
jgi:hypothetical protein